nr:helix-turn-helix transcriptional regulator [uncultured Draconibacterium sp.]
MKSKTLSRYQHEQLRLLGQFFRELRFVNGLTQNELSQMTNVHYRTIQRLEQGENVTALSIIEIGDTLGIDIIKELWGE